MCKLNSRLLIALLTFGVSLIGVSLWYGFYRYSALNNEEVRFTEPEIIGFSEVITASDGSVVTTYGWIDTKSLCYDITQSQNTICTAALAREAGTIMEIRLRICGGRVKSNCIDWKNKSNCKHQVGIYDNHSSLIDGSEQIKLTGRISSVGGKGRFDNSDFIIEGKNNPQIDLPLSEVNLSQIGRINSEGRVQDIEYNQLRDVDRLIANGKESIPFLISKLTDETKVEGHSIDYWSDVRVGDVAFIILTDFFTDSSWKKSTLQNVGFDDFLGCNNPYNAANKCFDNYLKEYGRKSIQSRWQKIWLTNKDRIYWNESERYFHLKQ